MTTEVKPRLEEHASAPDQAPQMEPAIKLVALRAPEPRALLPHLGVLLFFVLATIACSWPLFPRLGGFVVTRDDPVQAVYEMAWQAHALVTNPLNLLQANINYPFNATLAFNEISFSEALLAAPIYWLTGNPVLSHNAVVLLAYVMGGYGVWLLARLLTGNSWAALVAGSAFAFSFWMVNNLQHTTPVSAGWLPFTLLAAYKLLFTGRWRWAAALALFFALNALSSHYLAFYGAILLGLFLVYYFITARRAFTWGMIGRFAVALGVGGLLVLPIAIPYAIVQGSYSFGRDLFEVERFSNTLISFLAVYRANPLYQALLAPFADSGPWPVERSAFLGLAAPLLGLIGLVWAWRRRRASSPDEAKAARAILSHGWFFAIVALVSAVLSLGPVLQLTYAANVYDRKTIKAVLPLPYLLLFDWVPGFGSMRVASRIGVLLALALGMLAAIGALALLRWLAGRVTLRGTARLALPALALILALLPLAETWSAPVTTYPIATREAVPAVYNWLAAQPPTVIVEYPMVLKQRGPENVAWNNLVQYYSVYHWQKMLNGAVTIKPYAYSAIIGETEDCFPCPRSLDALWLLDVQYVVVHLDMLTEPQRTDFLWRSVAPAAKVVDSFQLVQDFGNERVYKLLAPRDVGQVAGLIPAGATVQLDTPEGDPLGGYGDDGEYLGGGYMAALGWRLRDHALYGDARLTFGETIHPLVTSDHPQYALLWAGRDPATVGYAAADKLWSNEFVALYRSGATR